MVKEANIDGVRLSRFEFKPNMLSAKQVNTLDSVFNLISNTYQKIIKRNP